MDSMAGPAAGDDRVVASPTLRARGVAWLVRHPMAAVIALLVATTAIALFASRAVRPDGAQQPTGSPPRIGVAPSLLPEPTQTPPAGRVEAVHRSLHATGRACRIASADREPGAVRRPVTVMLQFARDYPGAGFRIDDESGSTLSLLVVLRYDLGTCHPALVPAVEALLPEELRDPE